MLKVYRKGKYETPECTEGKIVNDNNAYFCAGLKVPSLII